MKALTLRLVRAPRRLEGAMAKAVVSSAEQAAEAARGIAPVDSGELKSGIRAAQTGKTEAAAVSTAPHGAMVEYGTFRMAPRPHMLPAARSAEAGFFEAARAAAKEVLK